MSLIRVSLNAHLSIIAALYVTWSHKDVTYYLGVSWRVHTSDAKGRRSHFDILCRRSHFDILRRRSYFGLLIWGDCCKNLQENLRYCDFVAGARSHQFFQVPSSPYTFSIHHVTCTCNLSLTLWSTLNTLVASLLHMLNADFAIFTANTNYFRVIGSRPEPKFYIRWPSQDRVRADP